MSGNSLRKSLLATAAAGAVAIGTGGLQTASAALLDGWNLNLSVANTLTGATHEDLTNLDEIRMIGESTVIQSQTFPFAFTDSGHLELTAVQFEGGVPLPGEQPITDIDGAGSGLNSSFNLYFTFSGLTGNVINAAGDITFDPGVGTISLWLDDDLTDFDPTTMTAGTSYKLADFKLVDGGGQGVGNFGGGQLTGTVQVSLEMTGINGGLTGCLYTDSANTCLDFGFVTTFHFGDLNAELQSATGTDPMTFQIENNGSYNLSTEPEVVPEPSSIAALGLGLLGFAGIASRRRRRTV